MKSRINWSAIQYVNYSGRRLKKSVPILYNLMRQIKLKIVKTNPCFRYEGETGGERNLVILTLYRPVMPFGNRKKIEDLLVQ